MEFKTACGGMILVPPKAQEHLRAHPEVGKLLAEAIGQLLLPPRGKFLAVEVEMGRVVGRSGCVPTAPIGPRDSGAFALRVGRERPSRVIVGVEGPETTKVVVLAFPAREEARTYVLVTSYVGVLAPKEPWDRRLAPGSSQHHESLDFWCSHALVYSPEVMGEVFASSWDEVLSL